MIVKIVDSKDSNFENKQLIYALIRCLDTIYQLVQESDCCDQFLIETITELYEYELMRYFSNFRK